MPRAVVRRAHPGEKVPVPSRPDAEWTNDDIKQWLDDHGIEYLERDTKDALLERLP